ncbi:MAG: hypothetical protein GDA49_01805 [Rhodospirillales bacterium]|nr:hypothetical protein [Rhodospirillales bacterium]
MAFAFVLGAAFVAGGGLMAISGAWRACRSALTMVPLSGVQKTGGPPGAFSGSGSV